MWSGGHRSGNLDLCDVKTIISSISRGILNAVRSECKHNQGTTHKIYLALPKRKGSVRRALSIAGSHPSIGGYHIRRQRGLLITAPSISGPSQSQQCRRCPFWQGSTPTSPLKNGSSRSDNNSNPSSRSGSSISIRAMSMTSLGSTSTCLPSWKHCPTNRTCRGLLGCLSIGMLMK